MFLPRIPTRVNIDACNLTIVALRFNDQVVLLYTALADSDVTFFDCHLFGYVASFVCKNRSVRHTGKLSERCKLVTELFRHVELNYRSDSSPIFFSFQLKLYMSHADGPRIIKSRPYFIFIVSKFGFFS
jgi:hypothetical protein